MKKNIIQITFIAILILSSACNDFLKQYSQDLVVPKTPSDLDEVLVGGNDGYLPSEIINDASGGVNIAGRWFNVLDDDINTVIAPTGAGKGWLGMSNLYFGYTTWQLQVGRNLKGTNVGNEDELWNDLYHRINSMNIILKQLDELAIQSEEDRRAATRIKGECLFLRAQFYFTLANIYGKAYSPVDANTALAVPLKLTEYVVYDKNAKVLFPRATVGEIYTQIVSDLNQSLQALTESVQRKPRYRASKESVLQLLCRVHMYMQDWENAKKYGEQFLETKHQLLDFHGLSQTDAIISVTNPELVFTQGSLTMQQGYSGEGTEFCVSSDLYKLFSENDLRKSAYFKKNGKTDSIAVNKKFDYNSHRAKVSDVFSMRTAEVYLNVAEACAMLGKDADALRYLNTLRQYRYNENEPINYSAEALVKEIRDERRRELCFEAHRWFDLRRYAVDVKYPMKKEIARTFAIYDYERNNVFLSADMYKLPADDPAYVFQIPKKLLEQEPDQIPNPREERKGIPIVSSETE